jgi:hypothetical protein
LITPRGKEKDAIVLRKNYTRPEQSPVASGVDNSFYQDPSATAFEVPAASTFN